MKIDIWNELKILEDMTTRHKRGTSLKENLLIDLKLIEERIKEIRRNYLKDMFVVEKGAKNEKINNIF